MVCGESVQAEFFSCLHLFHVCLTVFFDSENYFQKFFLDFFLNSSCLHQRLFDFKKMEYCPMLFSLFRIFTAAHVNHYKNQYLEKNSLNVFICCIKTCIDQTNRPVVSLLTCQRLTCMFSCSTAYSGWFLFK